MNPVQPKQMKIDEELAALHGDTRLLLRARQIFTDTPFQPCGLKKTAGLFHRDNDLIIHTHLHGRHLVQ